MTEWNIDHRCNRFWEACDEWVWQRMEELARDGTPLDEGIAATIDGRIEGEMTALLEECLERYGESFNPLLLTDLHHLLFELELQKRGVANQLRLHRYKDNGMLALSVARGTVQPDHALLLMELNRAHQEKKRGNEDAVCEDCVCGKHERG